MDTLAYVISSSLQVYLVRLYLAPRRKESWDPPNLADRFHNDHDLRSLKLALRGEGDVPSRRTTPIEEAAPKGAPVPRSCMECRSMGRLLEFRSDAEVEYHQKAKCVAAFATV